MVQKLYRALKKRLQPVRRNIDLLAKATGESIRAQYPKERLKEKARKTAILLGVILLGPIAVALLLLGAANAFGFEYWSARKLVMDIAEFVMHPPAWDSEGHWAIRGAGVVVSHGPLAVSALLAAVAAWHLLWAIFWSLTRHHFERTFTTPEFQAFVRDALGKYFGPTLLGTSDSHFLPIAPIRLRAPGGPVIAWEDRTYRPWKHAKDDTGPRWLLRMHRALKRPTIRFRDRIGFAATRIESSYESISVRTCKYQEDQDSAYRLGFEYYLWFLLCRRNRSGHKTPVLTRCPLHLKALLTDIGEWKKHCKGHLIEHHELGALLNDQVFEKHVRTQLGVQALVVFRDYQDLDANRHPRWKVVLQKRSPDVSSSPNHLQFIPSGGFESHQQLHGESIDRFTESLLAREIDLKRALLREFAEEVLGLDEFMANENYDPAEILREPGVRSLNRAIDSGTAGLHCLGVAMSLIGFKGEISYVLWIDHPSYFLRHRLKRSEGEARVIFTWPLAELDELVNSGEHPLVDASRTLLHMAVHDDWWDSRANGKGPRLEACDIEAIRSLRAQTPAFNDPLPPVPEKNAGDALVDTVGDSQAMAAYA